MPEFAYTELLSLGPDTTEYRLLTTEGVSTLETDAGTFVQVAPEALTLLTQTAMRESPTTCGPRTYSNCATSSTIPKPATTINSSPSTC